jgi:hypothetical protein
MPVFNRNRHSGSSGVIAAYTIDNSIRCNDDDNVELQRTWSGGSRRIFTFSFWIKRCNLTLSGQGVAVFRVVNAQDSVIRFNASDKLEFHFEGQGAGANKVNRITTRVFRDPSAWMHVVIGIDRNQTDDTSAKLEINGEEVTAWDTKENPSSAVDDVVGQGIAHTFFQDNDDNHVMDAYIAELVFIDGTKLAASSFGETNSEGNWVPIDVSGLTFGTEGHYLDFAVAPGTGDGAGTDVSGEGNHYTEAGFAANDLTKDSPTDDADNDVGNYSIISGVQHPTSSVGSATFSNGNLTCDWGNAGATAMGSIGVSSGKWYWEVTIDATSTSIGVGIIQNVIHAISNADPETPWNENNGYGYRNDDGDKVGPDGTTATYGDTYGVGEVIGVEFDADAGTINFWNQGVDQGEAYSSISGVFFPAVHSYHGTTIVTMNFGQHTMVYTNAGVDRPAVTFLSLHTANLPAPTITDPSKYFQADLFTGTGAELAITLTDAAGGAVKPDLVWIKDRDTSIEHVLTDSARGATKEISSNDNASEQTVAQGLKSFDTSGFTLGTDASYNASSSLNVAWCWVGSSGAGASNTDGTINTTTTSVSTTAGFSVSTYTGNGTAGATVGHGLGVVPDWVFVRKLSGSTEHWTSYHGDETDYLNLNDTGATADNIVNWNDTAPTSSVFSIGSGVTVNESGVPYVVYCWTGVEGYSKFGNYEGNASSDGPFVWCGFRPAWILIKDIDATRNWILTDSARAPSNQTNAILLPDEAGSEETSNDMDILSNGFKLRTTNGGTNYASTYMFAAFAEFPFGGDGVSQARAR